MGLSVFIITYRWQLIIVAFVANVLFGLGIRLQKKYERAWNGWFVCGYMLVNMYVPFFLFLLLIK